MNQETRILSIDIGGSHIKATILDYHGNLLMDYERANTPPPSNPENFIKAIQSLIHDFPEYDKVSVGFPGYVKDGIICTAPNLGTEIWTGYDLRASLETALDHPVHVFNDADMQGLGIVSGKGYEMVLTLGTGFGTAFLLNGVLLPHIELSQHPVTKKFTYDQYIGQKALDGKGKEQWNKRMQKVLEILKKVFNYDRLYISGGNSSKLTFELEDNIMIASNKDGIKGGARLWQMAP